MVEKEAIKEKSEQGTIRSGESAFNEANEGRAQFVREQSRQERTRRVTDLLGKVDIVDNGKTLTKRTERASDALLDPAVIKKTAEWFEERLGHMSVPADEYLKKLQGIPKAELRAVSEAYNDTTGRKLDADLKQELEQAKLLKDPESERKLTKALEILQGVPSTDKQVEAATAAKPTDKDKPATAPESKPAEKDGTERSTKTFSDKSSLVSVGGQITEVVAADGHTRKFHYDANGKVDQIDGRLGHWDRSVDEHGAVSWKNKNTGAEWKGEFTVDADGNLHFQRNSGSTFIFGRNGETTRVAAEHNDKTAARTPVDGASERGDSAKAEKTKVETEAPHKYEYKMTSFPNKPQESTSVDADGTVHYEYADGTRETQKPNQVQIDYPDNSGFRQTASGERDVWHGNGDQEFYVNGKLVSQWTKQSDGSSFRTDSEGRITTVMAPDGGTLELQRHDKTKVETDAPQGYKYGMTSFPEKHKTSTSVDADGTVHYEYADGTKETQKPNELQVDLADKSGYKLAADGKRSVWNANGDEDIYVKGKLVTQWAKQPDGTDVRKGPDGQVTAIFGPDGQTRREFDYDSNGDPTKIRGDLGSWTREVDSDGKVYWQNQKDPKLQWHGVMEVDKDGQLHYTPHDPKAHAWVFTRDGRELRVARPQK